MYILIFHPKCYPIWIYYHKSWKTFLLNVPNFPNLFLLYIEIVYNFDTISQKAIHQFLCLYRKNCKKYQCHKFIWLSLVYALFWLICTVWVEYLCLSNFKMYSKIETGWYTILYIIKLVYISDTLVFKPYLNLAFTAFISGIPVELTECGDRLPQNQSPNGQEAIQKQR